LANVRIRLRAVGTGVSPATAGDSYAFDHIVFDCNEHLAPSGFSYAPNSHKAVFGKSGSSKVPKVNWHNDQGSFSLHEPPVGITIDSDTGAILWSDGLAVGDYPLTIIAKNKAGEARTTFALTLEKPVILPPSDFHYTPNIIALGRHDGGKTVFPEINWNNHQGTFAFVGAVDPEIKLDPKTGQITWSEKMTVGNHHLTISATNQAGVTTTDFKSNKAEPKIPFDFGYRPDHMTILMHESGKTVPPTINWNNAPGTFVLVSSLPAGFDFDPETAVISWASNTSP
jgi:hypothetical protein